MNFALFYEIPVPRPGATTASSSPTRTRSSRRSPATASAGTRSGRSSTTSSRSIPTARTRGALRRHCGPDREHPARLRRPLDAQALQPPGPHRRIGRRARSPLERAGRHGRRPLGHEDRARRLRRGPRRDTPDVAGGLGHIVGCWTNDEYEFEGEHWQMPKRRVVPKPWQRPHPPLWGATTSDEGHAAGGRARPGVVFVRRRPTARRKSSARSTCTGPPYRTAPSPSAPSSTIRRRPSPWPCAVPIPTGPKRKPASPSSGIPRREPARSPPSPTGWPSASRSWASYSYAADMKKSDDEGTARSPDSSNISWMPTPASWARPTSASRPAGSTRRPASTSCSAW